MAPTDRHGGNLAALARRGGRAESGLLDFSANINPIGAPACVRDAVLRAAERIAHYPDPDSTALREAIAGYVGVQPQRIVPGNGSEQLIWWLPRLLDARRVVLPVPGYIDYHRSAQTWRIPVELAPLRAGDAFRLDLSTLIPRLRAGDLVWIGHPNNPTGRLAPRDELCRAAEALPGVHWAVDEAFIDFVGEGHSFIACAPPNLIVLRSMTKFFALAGLRLGCAVLRPDLARALSALLPDWSVGTFAQVVGRAVLSDPGLSEYGARTRSLIGAARAQLATGLRDLGADVIDGSANYLLFRLPQTAPPAAVIADRLLRDDGIAVRVCDNYSGLDQRWLRVAVRLPSENQRLIGALASAGADPRAGVARDAR
jgi:L-threonine-O-3-phosphate decarboxylase